MAHVRRKPVGKNEEAVEGKKRRRLISDSDEEEERDRRALAAPPPGAPLSAASKYGELSTSAGMRQGMGSSGGSSEKNKPAELFRKDLISAMKMPDSEPLLPEEYILICDPWRQDWEKGVQVPVNSEFILDAKVVAITEAEKTGSFKMPRKLIRISEDTAYSPSVHELTDTAGLAEKACRYDLDDLDVAWLERYNDERQLMGQEPVPEFVMEKVMEELETQCHDNMEETIRNSEGLGIEYDENVVCDVCKSPDSEENNEMVFCDGCNVCVHQACYGVYKIPDGAWLCRTCALGVKPACLLCPKKGGAMKSTKSGRNWAHVSCALWIPEVSIGDAEKMEPVTKISHIPPSRWNLVCALCREKTGACIQCDLRACKTAFHVTCAFEHKLEMKTVMDEAGLGGEVKLKAFCQKHTEEHKAAAADIAITVASAFGSISATTSPVKVASPLPMTSTRQREIPCSPSKKDLTDAERAGVRAQKIAELNDSFYACVKPTDVAAKLHLDESMLDGCRGDSGGNINELVDFVYEYWKLKRRSWFNAPLLTPKTEEADFLTRQQEDSLIARMKMFVHLRQDLEKVRNLCYMISRREKTRKLFYRTREEVFHKQLECVLGDLPTDLGLSEVLSANHSDSIYDNPAQWEPLEPQDELPSAVHTVTTLDKLPAASPPSDVFRLPEHHIGGDYVKGRVGGKDKGKENAVMCGKGPPSDPPQTAAPAAGSSKYKINKAIRDVVHSKIFHTRRPKPYVNGVYDRTQRRLDTYFASIPVAPVDGGLISSPETRSASRRIETRIGVKDQRKLFETVDSEVSICVSPNGREGIKTKDMCVLNRVELDKENNGDMSGADSDGDIDVISDDLMYPVVSDTFPKRVTRSRLSESLEKVWKVVTGVYRN